ncbi:hypothetical protein [Nocardioides sp. NPDC127503]|uniref:hypothetical protein n=1 Tax=Nocardioides sp. NPDC127503 TaxID=3154516 RepID=UPI003333915B
MRSPTHHAVMGHGLPLEDVDEAAENRMLRKQLLGTGERKFAFLVEPQRWTTTPAA